MDKPLVVYTLVFVLAGVVDSVDVTYTLEDIVVLLRQFLDDWDMDTKNLTVDMDSIEDHIREFVEEYNEYDINVSVHVMYTDTMKGGE